MSIKTGSISLPTFYHCSMIGDLFLPSLAHIPFFVVGNTQVISLLAHLSLTLAEAVLPMWRFFFKLQAPLTRYLHPCLIYAIRGSIVVCLIHSFILLSLSPSRFFFFFLKKGDQYLLIYPGTDWPFPLSILPQWHANRFYTQATLLWGSEIGTKQV